MTLTRVSWYWDPTILIPGSRRRIAGRSIGSEGYIGVTQLNSPVVQERARVLSADDQARLQDLEDAVRHYLAWQSILDDRERLDLPPHQRQTGRKP